MTTSVLDNARELPRAPHRRWRRRGGRPPLWLMTPSFLVMGIVTYLPLLLAIVISLTALNQYTIGNAGSLKWTGAGNYADILTPGGTLSVLSSIRTSVLFSVLATALSVPIAVAAAMLVNARFRGRAVLRTVLLVPFILPAFASALIWRLILQTGSGALDEVLHRLGIGSGNTIWLIGPNSFWALVIAGTWTSWPYVYIMVLAALQAVPAELYDAAAVDGARWWRRFWTVVVPAIRPTLALAVCLCAITHFNNFTLPFILFGSPPPPESDVLPTHIYSASFTSFDFGQAAAIAVVNLIVLLVPVAYYLKRVSTDE